MSLLRIEVRGLPAPQGSKRFVGMRGGKGVMVESSAKVKPWREDVRHAAERALSLAFLPPFDEAVCVRMVFTLPKPTSAPKRRVTYPMRTPDLSKLIRSTEDALTSAGVWRDDARVVETFAAKRYPGEGLDALDVPGAVILVWGMQP